MIVFYIFSADGRNKSRKPCSPLIAFGKCYQSCKLNHTFSSGNVSASMKMLLASNDVNNLKDAADLIRALVNANQHSSYYDRLFKSVSNSFVEAVKNSTSDQKRKIFHFLNNKGRKAVITRFAERLGMNEVAEAYLLGSSLIEKEDTGPFKKRKKIQICL